MIVILLFPMSAFVYEHNELFDGMLIHMPPSYIFYLTHLLSKQCTPFWSGQNCKISWDHTIPYKDDCTQKSKVREWKTQSTVSCLKNMHFKNVDAKK